jgi:hypothetical protein
MAECPRIVTYLNADIMRAGDGTAPGPMIGSLWLARLSVVNSETHEFSWWGFPSMIFEGDSEQAVIDAARKFWTEKTAKIEARRVSLAKARAARHG